MEHDPIDYDAIPSAELVRRLKAQSAETLRLRQWVVSVGQPAVEKVDELEQMLEVYEAERNEKVDELQRFQTRLSVMDDMQDQLRRHKSASHSLLQEKDSLLVAMEESAQRHSNQRRKYEEAVRECMKYKKLAADLEEINKEFSARNELQFERLNVLQEDYDAQERYIWSLWFLESKQHVGG